VDRTAAYDKGYREACQDVAFATLRQVAATRLHIMKALEYIRNLEAQDLPEPLKADRALACFTVTMEMAVHFLGRTLNFLETVEGGEPSFYRGLTNT